MSEYNPEVDLQDIQAVVEDVVAASKDQMVQDYVNGRVEIVRRSGKAGSLNHGQLAVEAKNAVAAKPRRYAGKSTLKAIRTEFQKMHKMNLAGGQSTSEFLSDGTLATIATKLPKAK